MSTRPARIAVTHEALGGSHEGRGWTCALTRHDRGEGTLDRPDRLHNNDKNATADETIANGMIGSSPPGELPARSDD